MDELHGHVTVIQNHRCAHVVLSGDVDLALVEHLERELHAVVADPPPITVLTLAGVEFIGLAAVGTLITLRNACAAAGQELVIAERSPAVERLFELAGLSSFFGLEDAADHTAA